MVVFDTAPIWISCLMLSFNLYDSSKLEIDLGKRICLGRLVKGILYPDNHERIVLSWVICDHLST